jgi:hypothetical protein
MEDYDDSTYDGSTSDSEWEAEYGGNPDLRSGEVDRIVTYMATLRNESEPLTYDSFMQYACSNSGLHFVLARTSPDSDYSAYCMGDRLPDFVLEDLPDPLRGSNQVITGVAHVIRVEHDIRESRKLYVDCVEIGYSTDLQDTFIGEFEEYWTKNDADYIFAMKSISPDQIYQY